MTILENLSNSDKAYIDEIVARGKSSSRYFLSFISAFLILTLTFLLVWMGPWIGFPADAAKYAKDTLPFAFSHSTLAELSADPNIGYAYNILVTCYWAYWIGVGAMVFAGIMGIKRALTAPHERGIYELVKVINIGDSWIRRQDNKSKKYLDRAIQNIDPYFKISPLRLRWYEKDIQQWITPNDLPPETRKILIALARLKPGLAGSIESPQLFLEFREPLSYLVEYYLFIERRRQLRRIGIENTEKNGTRLLASFAQSALHPIGKGEKFRKEIVDAEETARQKEQKWRLPGPVIRRAAWLSGLSAVVMGVGIVFVSITIKQAFITWFIATFGGLFTIITIRSDPE